MTDNIYTGFGSHVVLEPQDSRISDGVKHNNVSDPGSRWRNLRLQLRYFTIRARPEDTTNYASINNLKESITCEASAENVNITNDGRVLVIETHSCDSFHSCQSSASNKDLSKPSQEYGKKNRHQRCRSKSSEEEFHDQITMINAIFLNKKTSKDNQSGIKNENLINKTNVSDLSISDLKCSLKSDQSSGDRTLEQTSVNCKCSSHQKLTENIGTPQNSKEHHQEHSDIEGTELSHEKLSANKPVFKTLKINRKTIYGTKKPLMSKIIGRKGHQTMIHKLQPLKRLEIKYPRVNRPADETPHSPEDENELYKGIILKVKQGISEGYEIHFLEPIQLTNHSIAVCSENAPENLNSDVIHSDKEINSQNKKCVVVNSFDDFEESFLKLFNKLQNSDPSVQPPEDLKGTESRFDSGSKGSIEEVKEAPNRNSNLNFESTKYQDLLPDKKSEQENCTILYESENQFSDLSLNKTFEILFEDEGCWLEKTDSNYQNPETHDESTCEEKKAVEESSESRIESRPEERMATARDHSTGITITKNSTINTHSKRRQSSTRKSSLPVILESPEPAQETLKDVLDNDYCLVDTLGRSIHLFDGRGYPLTDSSGRPLRTAGGELLLKCDDNGIPVVDDETYIFDMFGRQPHEEGFQPWMSPQDSRANRLTLRDGRPLVLFDVEGKPLTSISGTMLVDRCGRSLLKLNNCFTALHS